MKKIHISDSIFYVGVDDRTIDLFESQYVVPNGISYNSYVMIDEKIAVMDTVDERATSEWLVNVKEVLGGKAPDYLVISHMEPDHAGSIQILAEQYPDMQLVGNAKTFQMAEQFFSFDMSHRTLVVKEGDTLKLGNHTLQFVMAPMVHWPEVMVTYEQKEKILFAADAFGKFGTLDTEEDWTCEARRYYFNIVGKYGMQVQILLKKAEKLDISMICPLHGPVLKDNLEYYIGKYQVWSSYLPEDEGVLIAYASIHGNTAKAAKKLAELLKAEGVQKVVLTDLARDDMAEAIEDAFRYDKLVVAASTYDGGLFPCAEEFLQKLVHKNYQKRTIGLIENGTWAPVAAKHMKEICQQMKEVSFVEPFVTIKSALNEESTARLEELAHVLSSK